MTPLSIKKFLANTAYAVLLAQVAVMPAIADGGSHGGTNTDKATGELVEFVRTGNRVPIDPTKFENLYPELKSRIDAIEYKVPQLGKSLESVLHDHTWYVTTEKFVPRNSGEEQPIFQDSEHVLLNAESVKGLTHEQLKRAWLHEMVRRIVTVSPSNRASEAERAKTLRQNDALTEALTVILYQEYDLPAQQLAKRINDTIGRITGSWTHPYASRPEFKFAMETYDIRNKYARTCKALDLKSPTSLWSSGDIPKGYYRDAACLRKAPKNPYDFEELERLRVSCLKPGLRDKAVRVLDLEKMRNPLATPVLSSGFSYPSNVPFFQMASFESALDSGISGIDANHYHGGKPLTDDQRVLQLVDACLSMDEATLQTIEQISSTPGDLEAQSPAAESLEQALTALDGLLNAKTGQMRSQSELNLKSQESVPAAPPSEAALSNNASAN